MELVMLPMMLLSVVMAVVFVAVMLTYVVRTWQMIRGEDLERSDERILDKLEQIASNWAR